MESWLFLALILLVAFLAKNKSLIFATIVVLILKLFMPYTTELLNTVRGKGINWGVTLITVAILIPIATGEITLKDLWVSFQSPLGWIAVICGAAVAVFSKHGVGLINQSPQVTIALVFGTILGVVLFRGIAAGPVIAAGMTYCIFSLVQMIMR